MNPQDLLDIIGQAQEAYILDAIQTRGGVPRTGRRLIRRRALLIAAAIAMTFLLVGCGIVYVLRLQDMTLGSRDLVYEAWNEDLTDSWYVTSPQHLLSLSGLAGTPGFQAAQEWLEFEKTYDPDRKIQASVWGKEPKFPAQYQFYSPYSQAMVDKIDEIAQKYSLKLMGAPVKTPSPKSLLAYLGIDSLLLPGAPATASELQASYCENGYLDAFFTFHMDAGEGRYTDNLFICYYYSRKDCFNTRFCEVSADTDWEESTYTTASGQTVLILHTEGRAWVFCDKPEAMIAVRVDFLGEDTSTDSQRKQIVDCLDFSLEPRPGVPSLLDGLPTEHSPADQVQTQNGSTLELKSVQTDGHMAYITLGVTVPQGVDARRLSFGAWDLLPKVPTETTLGHNATYMRWDDGDGLDNTTDFIIQWESDSYADGTIPFSLGSQWRLYLEDIQIEEWDGQYHTLWSGGGVWKFDITFDEHNDYREVEFIETPVTLPLAVGWKPDGTDFYDDVTIASLTMRSFGGKATFSGKYTAPDMCDYAGERYPLVVLKDGKTIALDANLDIRNREEKIVSIPLDEIDHLLLIDGTKLYPQP